MNDGPSVTAQAATAWDAAVGIRVTDRVER